MEKDLHKFSWCEGFNNRWTWEIRMMLDFEAGYIKIRSKIHFITYDKQNIWRTSCQVMTKKIRVTRCWYIWIYWAWNQHRMGWTWMPAYGALRNIFQTNILCNIICRKNIRSMSRCLLLVVMTYGEETLSPIKNNVSRGTRNGTMNKMSDTRRQKGWDVAERACKLKWKCAGHVARV